MIARIFVVGGLLLTASCEKKQDAGEARKALASTEPSKRQEGATVLQKMYAKDPTSLGDHGEKHWVEQLAKIPGTSNDEAHRILGGVQSRGSEGGGGGATDHVGLDDFWATDLYRDDRKNTITGYAPPRRHVAHVDIARPAGFTGTWTTYFVNGAVYDALEFERGIPRRSREYHDNAQLRSDHLYVDGLREGTVIIHFANGGAEWEESFAKGKKVGVEKWFYPNGKLRQEDHWANDKRDGRATFFSDDGTPTKCIDYRAGEEVGRGCSER